MRSAVVVLGLLTAACGPKQVRIDPMRAVDVQVRPRSGQALFCPGDAFQVEVVARIDDGSTCSNVDATRACLGEEGQVIAAELVRVEGSAGRLRDDFVWEPPSDPLVTAATGLTLRAWLEGAAEGGAHGRSMVAEKELTPVYDCQASMLFQAPPTFDAAGAPGAAGPEVRVAITTLSTPFYPAAALVRVEVGTQRLYAISPSVERAIRIGSRGADGVPGVDGHDGSPGASGATVGADAAACTRGGDGGDGSAGGDGGPGGPGGDGGRIVVTLDEAAADALRGRVYVESVPGAGGPGGMGGSGGPGGAGGMGGAITAECPDTAGTSGGDGADGVAGPAGPPGRGVPPELGTAPREQLFAAELATIRAIEATPGKR